jgi:hypothetical protein
MAWNAVKNAEVKNIAPVESGAPGHRYMFLSIWKNQKKK